KLAVLVIAVAACGGDPVVAPPTPPPHAVAVRDARIHITLPAVTDRDGDHVPDAVDKCPDDPEDFDGFEDHDGCPDADNDPDPTVPDADDHDGAIADVEERCPGAPDDNAGYEDIDGCPEPAPRAD